MMGAHKNRALVAVPLSRVQVPVGKVTLNTQIAEAEHRFLKERAKSMEMTVTAVLRNMIRREMEKTRAE